MIAEIVLEDDRWDEAALQARAEAAAGAVLAELGLPGAGFAFALLACSDARIAALNADFRGKPQPTNVLSWPAEERRAGRPGGMPALPGAGAADDPEALGDMALAYETCGREAVAAGRTEGDHVTHLIAHGLLHLLGFDHQTEADAVLMEGIERRALARMGIADPY